MLDKDLAGVYLGHTDIDDNIGASCPKPSDEEISAALHLPREDVELTISGTQSWGSQQHLQIVSSVQDGLLRASILWRPGHTVLW
jgi:hypothetical protein